MILVPGTWSTDWKSQTRRLLRDFRMCFSASPKLDQKIKRLVLFCSLLRSRHAFHQQLFCCQLIPTSHHIPSTWTEVQPSQQDHHLRLSLPHRLGLTELGREAWCLWCLELRTGMQLDKSWIIMDHPAPICSHWMSLVHILGSKYRSSIRFLGSYHFPAKNKFPFWLRCSGADSPFVLLIRLVLLSQPKGWCQRVHQFRSHWESDIAMIYYGSYGKPPLFIGKSWSIIEHRRPFSIAMEIWLPEGLCSFFLEHHGFVCESPMCWTCTWFKRLDGRISKTLRVYGLNQAQFCVQKCPIECTSSLSLSYSRGADLNSWVKH